MIPAGSEGESINTCTPFTSQAATERDDLPDY